MARVVFLGGLGRSGTTLIERVLGEVPGICAVGELVHLWQRDLRDDEKCACGSHFSACDFWERVGVAAFGGWHRVDVHRVLALRDLVERTRHIPRLATRVPAGYADLVREYADYYVRIYEAAAAVSGAEVIVDSSKHSALAHVLRHATQAEPPLDLRVLHVVRDARGVAYSWTKTVLRPEAAADEMTRYSPARSALLWTAHNAAFSLLRRRGVRVRTLRYEEFLADPQATLRRLVTFAGLDPSAVDLGWLERDQVTLGVSHSAAGNPMRFTTGVVPLRQDDAWRTHLAPRQRAVVNAVCAPMLKAYGYELGVKR
ncbi:sulfotransferase [Hamadaea sp. NPDC050747]|uniref:sulfotransferase n=1 Tax=Hamadaea sp. NPDC050747 TaxID=3155789 RepID=UPI0033DE6834